MIPGMPKDHTCQGRMRAVSSYRFKNTTTGEEYMDPQTTPRSGSANAPAPGPELLSGKWAALILLYPEDGPIRCIGPLRTEPGCGIYEDRKAGGDTRPIGRIPPPGPGGLHTEPMTQIKPPFAAGSQPGGVLRQSEGIRPRPATDTDIRSSRPPGCRERRCA